MNCSCTLDLPAPVYTRGKLVQVSSRWRIDCNGRGIVLAVVFVDHADESLQSIKIFSNRL